MNTRQSLLKSLANKAGYLLWNSLINATIIVINAHGTPESMKFGEEKFTTSDVNSLQYKTIKFVWLLSCNTGHYDYIDKNMARALARKVAGVVIAPDGIASGCIAGWEGIDEHYFCYVKRKNDEIVNAKDWYYYRDKIGSKRTTCYGWQLYKYLGSYSKYGVDITYGEGELLDIKILSAYLVQKGYVSYK